MQQLTLPLRAHFFDFWLARGAVLLAAILSAVLLDDLTILPSWVTSCVEVALLVPLSLATARTHSRMRKARTADHWAQIYAHRRIIRRAAILLTALVSLINFEALFGVMHALLYGAKGATGQTLLIDALNIWFTNVVVFALWFWNLDQGGPEQRSLQKTRRADFQFPQSSGEMIGYEHWTPGFIDYFFVSFTNATAFSPTDTMPLSHRSKLLFIVESSASLLTVGMVAARAVNILS